jgi:hypothetical protein
MMKVTLFVAAAAFSMVTAAARAESEGAGNPFPFSVPGVTTATATPRAYADTGSANYPDLSGRPAQVAAAGGLEAVPINGSEGVVQTAASLPRGFSNGTMAYVQAHSVARSFAEREGNGRLAAPRLAGAHRG